jgi:hypothetical protein
VGGNGFWCYHLPMKKILAVAALLHACTAMAAEEEWGQFDFEFDSDKPWVELQSKLPPYPKEDAYIPFYVSATADNHFFVDGKSISVGEDGVVRYTLIVKSPSGALNVTFEGMRCETAEKKVYAFGRDDGTWSKARFSKWEPIVYKDRNRQHHVLHDDFFCSGSIPVGSPEEAVRKLKAEASLVP